MVTTRGSSGGKRSNPLDAFGDRKHQRILGVQSAGIQRLGSGTEECFRLVHDILAQTTPGLWFRILPIDGQLDDICIGTGVEWQYLLPLLTKCGLLRSRVTSVVKDFHCNGTQWREMAKSFSSHIKMEVTCIRTWHSRRSYFYCIGKPTYNNPLHQEQALRSMGIPYKQNPPNKLMDLVKKYQQEYKTAHRIQSTPQLPINDE